MDPHVASAHDLFPHVRILFGMVIGLGVTRMLSGFARIVQHPGQYRLYPVHLAWAASVMLMLVHFWWWEFGLFKVEVWTFGTYFYLFCFTVTLFLLCALLFPDSLHDYRDYEDFFFARRAWFFGIMALVYVLDVGDTLLKGEAYFATFGYEYAIRTPLMIVLCLVAIAVRWRPFHIAFVMFNLGYQFSWIARHFNTLG